MKTLIVEDDFTSRLMLQTLLSRYGPCHVAVNGREAVQAAEIALDGGDPYNLVCMDILMPEMNGQEAVQKIRQLEEDREIYSDKGARIFMTTAMNQARDVMQAFHGLCDVYLFKPVDAGELLDKLRNYHLIQ